MYKLRSIYLNDLFMYVRLNIFWAKYNKSTLLINICQVKLVRCVVCFMCTVMINRSIWVGILPQARYYYRLKMRL